MKKILILFVGFIIGSIVGSYIIENIYGDDDEEEESLFVDPEDMLA